MTSISFLEPGLSIVPADAPLEVLGVLSVLPMIALYMREVQEHLARVRAVNAGVAAYAGLAWRRVAVRGCGRLACRRVQRRQMALQAKRVHIGLNEQHGIHTTVRKVASRASFRFYHWMRMEKWSGRRRVAFGAFIELP